MRALNSDNLTIFYSVPLYPDATADIRHIFLSIKLIRFPASCGYTTSITKIWNTGHVPCVKYRLLPCSSVNGKRCRSVLWGQSAQFCGDHLLLHSEVMSTAARPGGVLFYYSAHASTDQSANDITSYPPCS